MKHTSSCEHKFNDKIDHKTYTTSTAKFNGYFINCVKCHFFIPFNKLENAELHMRTLKGRNQTIN